MQISSEQIQKIEEHVLDTLKTCYDPEIPVNIYDLGLIYEHGVRDDATVYVKMTLTSPSCPVAETLPPEIEMKLRGIPGVIDVNVEVIWDPPWTPEKMSEAAKLELNMM
ncbi:MAG: DUF59 domain-containing protein [Deltaproteobacteria bacterium]|nr:DUF59 domain-containing protein [Deltaproteobacteria bacterium]